MPVPVSIIDAFTSEPFRGNPAAVCLLQEEREEQWMRLVAAEMNLSETAFLMQKTDGSYGLRWFTPLDEVDLCGHATLAAAHYLWEHGHREPEHKLLFLTRSGILTAERTADGITLDFPAEPVAPAVAPEELIQGLGLIPRYVGRNRMDYVVEVDSERTVRTLQPDMALLSRVETRGVIVTARADGGPGSRYDFVSRAFFPSIGINEDPVTGSAHCALAPYWQRRLRKDELVAYQASARGGELLLRPVGDRVRMSGTAVTVMNGHLRT
ncbi:PhzF family phenazine biosynthesis protein [Paenibacillus mendelii]|uniref:PhzF family phenazine biosynthesis protein n=1 Tax=Paenibacillus mendelii TaxID=206163 RepID=A0ABV6JAV4_9BACL|nr:PhzF family phenazine biosynthesis protein [Paenibacillus mendelii]MCQ6562908.1 PhzF family phenazine biosynthesis protein [Paenibacillus mendelii]